MIYFKNMLGKKYNFQNLFNELIYNTFIYNKKGGKLFFLRKQYAIQHHIEI